jgi:quercetin dioxygenase-like cupin family protein
MTQTDSTAREAIQLGQLSIRYLVDGSATEGIGLFEMIVPPNAQVPPPHSHTRNEECIFVLEGVLRCSVDGNVRDLAAGESAVSPKGSVHAFSNPHAQAARVLVIQSPDIGEQYFRDVKAAFGVGGPPDREKLFGVMASYGLVPAVPPQAPPAQAH